MTSSSADRHWRRPPFIANPLTRWALWIGAAVYLAVAFGTIDIDWNRIAEGIPRGQRFVSAFFPPDFASRWGEIVDATRGRILVGADDCAPPSGWSIDSRSLEAGETRGVLDELAACHLGVDGVLVRDEREIAVDRAVAPRILPEQRDRARGHRGEAGDHS